MSPEDAARYRFLQRVHDKAVALAEDVRRDDSAADDDRPVIEQPLAMVRDYCRRELGDNFEVPA